MSKKINNEIKLISIEKNCISKLNKYIEKFVVNTKVYIFVDFLTFQTSKKQLEEIKRCSLNEVEMIVANVNENFDKFSNLIEETNHLVVGIGEIDILKKVRDFAIKNNTNYAFLCKKGLKTDIFVKKTPILDYFPPYFVLIEEQKLTKKEEFLSCLSFFKFSYLFIESFLNYENEELKSFCEEYLKLIDFNKNINFQSKICELGKLLQKYEIKQELTDFSCEFKNYIHSYYFVLLYKNIFCAMNRFNLTKTRVKNLTITPENYQNYVNFDFKYYKFYLMSLKERFFSNACKVLSFYEKQLVFLKQNFNREYYNLSRFSSLFSAKNYDFSQTFLDKMKNFEIFNKIYQN